ncbi:MAG: glycosyltransferase [Armatimonadetes bacterium]|nr:glycosyltransferase [Armatimonadota bacterium]
MSGAGVSVIIPCYDVAPYVQGAVESVLAQDYAPLEVIVVDDGSRDETAEVLAPYVRAGAIRCVRQENRGLSAARNTGIRHAAGEYIALLDADDLFLPGKIAHQVARLEAEPECDVCWGAVRHFRDDAPEVEFDLRAPLVSGGREVFATLLAANVINPSTVMFRRKVVERHGLFDETLRRAEDLEYWLRLAHGGARFCATGRVLIRCRLLRPGSLSVNAVAMAEARLRVLERVNDRLSPEERREYGTARHLSHARWKAGVAGLATGDVAGARRHLRASAAAPATAGPAAALLAMAAALPPRFGAAAVTRGLALWWRVRLLRARRPPAYVPAAGRALGPTISVVILTWNSAPLLRRCLEALRAHGPRDGVEVIVVDNGSRDDVQGILRVVMPSATLIRNAANRGVAAARNQGLLRAAGRCVVLLDVDTEVRPGALERMADFLDRHPGAGVVGPCLVSPDGRVQDSCRRFPTVFTKLGRRVGVGVLGRLVREESYAPTAAVAVRPVDYAIGACQMIRRQTLEEVGLLDERMFYGPEDVDFCLRAWRAGWQVIYLPDAVVIHRERRVTRRLWSGLSWLHALALVRYFRKHGYWFSREKVYARLGRAAASGSCVPS